MASYGGKKDDDGDSTLMKADRTAVFQEGLSCETSQGVVLTRHSPSLQFIASLAAEMPRPPD